MTVDPAPDTANVLALAIAAAATAGVILRPRGLPEAIWAVAGAILLVVFGLLPWQMALAGVRAGLDVYLFLLGMMLLSEVARETGLFDWLAAIATAYAKGSASRLFLLIYGVGTLVTIFLSNDATAVVLTPAVAAAARSARVRNPLPYLLICAFVANAASFVLPISNPANLVLYGKNMPPLFEWLPLYLLPSAIAIIATFLLLRWTQRAELAGEVARDVPRPRLSAGGHAAGLGIIATAVLLLTVSAFDIPLGLPTAIAGVLTALLTLLVERASPLKIIRGVSWGVLPLVAGLFVLVEALDHAGVISELAGEIDRAVRIWRDSAALGAGVVIAFASNLMNNLPAGLVAANAMHSAQALPELFRRAVLIGVDVGPNLSVTGSLATILWLAALRREGIKVGAGAFLKTGMIVMPPALLLALCAAWLTR
ncbi:MAG: arsenic transporter [Rhizobiaceae bacterium]